MDKFDKLKDGQTEIKNHDGTKDYDTNRGYEACVSPWKESLWREAWVMESSGRW